MLLNIKSIKDTLRTDSGINGDAQRIEQIIWVLFLKLYDIYEKKWKFNASFNDETYNSILPEHLSWDKWAKAYDENGKALSGVLTGDELLSFVNNDLLPTLKNLNITAQTPLNQKIIKKAFEDTNNYCKDGICLRALINEIDKIDFKEKQDEKELSLIYESFLKELQSAGKAGEFYTPRAVTDFIMKILKPSLNESIADLACGTGGFLISAYHYIDENNPQMSANDRANLSQAFFGIEKKQLPYILCATNFLINHIDNPNLEHDNAFSKNFSELYKEPKFDIIAMNPPYGGAENESTKTLFPANYKSSETADLFMAIITERLKEHGRAAVVLPDGFLFGNDSAKINLKKRLIDEMNLHLIVRLPASVFAPYTPITTNILFFTKEKNSLGGTYIYRLDLAGGVKFSKTKPMKEEHFSSFWAWQKELENGKNVELFDENSEQKAGFFSTELLKSREYNLDLCGYPSKDEEILEPFALIEKYKNEQAKASQEISKILEQITDILKQNA